MYCIVLSYIHTVWRKILTGGNIEEFDKFPTICQYFPYQNFTFVTGFGKTDHIVTIDISRNTDLKYRSRHGSLVLDCSHARFAV